jgi:NAD(P)-dependent dehydrogenase (short-subunit alcohol dehydrogenase family)
MASEEQAPVVGWTVGTLLHYVDMRFDAAEKATAQRFADDGKAVIAALDAVKLSNDKAERQTERLFDQLRVDAEARDQSTNDALAVLQATVNRNSGGQSSTQRIWSILIPSFIGVASVVAIVVASGHP